MRHPPVLEQRCHADGREADHGEPGRATIALGIQPGGHPPREACIR
jgi:hypothetical protein